MEPYGQSPCYYNAILSYAPGAEALRCAGAEASEGYPPVAKSAGALIFQHLNDSTEACAFIHGQSPWSSA